MSKCRVKLILRFCLVSGKEIWRSEPYSAPYKPGPGENQFTAENRPRSTPAVAGGSVYTLGMSGVLSCLDAKSGKLGDSRGQAPNVVVCLGAK
jgi:PQQ-like domain